MQEAKVPLPTTEAEIPPVNYVTKAKKPGPAKPTA